MTPASTNVPKGDYWVRLTGYKGSDPIQLVHERTNIARLAFVEADEVT